jgi:hypothetical protein
VKSRLPTLVFVLVLSTLIVGGCGPTAAPPTGVPTAAPTQVPTEAPTPTMQPTREPQPTSMPAPEGPDEAISFEYGHALAEDVAVEIVAAEEFMGRDVIPEHVRLSFQGYALPDTFHEPRIHIYPVREFEAGSQVAANTMAGLRQFLAEKPTAPDGIPFLPMFNAGQMMRTQIAYVDFQSGTGVRFLTQYAQAAVPINNHEMFYTFQGMTYDGSYYVAAILPVSHPTLPAAATEDPGDDFRANFDSYVGEIERQLDAQGASSFTPDLSLLDAMIQSLGLPPAPTPPSGEQGSPAVAPDERTPTSTPPSGAQGDLYSGWPSYVNADYGFAFRYPPAWTLEEEAHLVKLRQEALKLVIGYRRDTEDELSSLGDLPGGSFEHRGTVTLLGQEFPKSVLVYEGEDKVVLTGGKADGLVFTVRLDALGADAAGAIPDAIHAELDRILSSFAWVSLQ